MLALDQAAFRAQELERPRHADPRRLLRYGTKAYSQSDEDGIIAEIFRRVGTRSRSFVEIGVQEGVECISLWLLLQGWSGLWIEVDRAACQAIRRSHGHWLESGALRLACERVTVENADSLVAMGAAGGEVDLLSIDTDYSDYWIWKAIETVHPRVVVIEYNASWPPPAAITVPCHPAAQWDGKNHFGASLAALARLGEGKGYALVGCGLSGVNAFFVRHDLLLDRFLNPGSAEDHYEPPRYFLSPLVSGHPPGIGPVVDVG